LRIIC